jgi:hypothetical protein
MDELVKGDLERALSAGHRRAEGGAQGASCSIGPAQNCQPRDRLTAFACGSLVALSNKRAHARPWCHAIRSGRRGDTLPDVLPPRSSVCLTPDGPVTRRPVLPLCQLRVRLGDTKRQTSDLVRRRQRPPKIRLTFRRGPHGPAWQFSGHTTRQVSQGPPGLLATRQIDVPRRRYRGGDPARFTPCRCDRVDPHPCRPALLPLSEPRSGAPFDARVDRRRHTILGL